MRARSKTVEERAAWLSRHILPHEPALRAQLSRWKLPDDLEANDVVQEAYAKLAMLESIDTVRNPKAYFFQVARSIILMHVRRSRVVAIQTVEQIDSLSVPSDEPGPDEKASDSQQLHLLAKMISELPDNSRGVMTMRLVEDLSHREIGERLGMSANAVQKNLAKSLAMFIKRLGRGGNASCQASNQLDLSENEALNAETRDQR